MYIAKVTLEPSNVINAMHMLISIALYSKSQIMEVKNLIILKLPKITNGNSLLITNNYLLLIITFKLIGINYYSKIMSTIYLINL